jgi:MFS superfamily sulfate permease-like transporter
MENSPLPKSGFAGFKAHFKQDFISGFSVSLIALPLCLGIAIASGFPPLAGLITAIVGGIFASRLAGSFVTISGPAAGLIVISLAAIESLGGAGAANNFAGYPHALGAIVIAGALVALFGLLKFGKIGDFFPSAAVHGMLAAIGVIIIIKQIFPALGVASPKAEIIEAMLEIPHAFADENFYATFITLITLAILILHPMLKFRIIRLIPAPMWVLVIIVPIAQYFGTEHLIFVDLPDHLFGADGIKFPSFEKIGLGAFWIAVAGFTLVSAIESLLSAAAVDSLDPYKRSSNLDKDLIAMGAGSSLAASIGGLPMISEIVRSSANINNGGKTQWANFYHGVLLLIYVLVLAFALELIPTAALAAMLVFTGFRLAHPREFKHTAAIGSGELIIFIITLVAVLATDLLIGIGVGILANFILLISKGAILKRSFSVNAEIKGNTVYLAETLMFSNYLSIKKKIITNTIDNEVNLDFTKVTLIDHTVMHHLDTLKKTLKRKGIMLNLLNMDHLNPVSEHSLAERTIKIKALQIEKILTTRQTLMLGLAAKRNWNYMLKQDAEESWDFYSITMRKKIVSIENTLIDSANGVTYLCADITTQEGARTTEEFQYVTAIKIHGLPNYPKFFMMPETIIDRLTDLISSDDIDFDTHPKFSNQYILKGEDEGAIRQFFTPALLSFFENHPPYFLISNGEDLLIRGDLRFLQFRISER